MTAGLSSHQMVIVWASFLLAVGAFIALGETSNFDYLPTIDDAQLLSRTFLGIQAAVATITLAVMVFVLQGVQGRDDIDADTHREYLSRSYVRAIFTISLLAVALTSVAVIVIHADGHESFLARPGSSNLLLVGVGGLAVNLTASFLLFERTLQLSEPTALAGMKADVARRSIEQGARSFVVRVSRPDEWGGVFSRFSREADELAARVAVRRLLEEARAAARQGHVEEFREVLASLRELTEAAMGALEDSDFQWGRPGQQPGWPPLIDIHDSLYSFVEVVVSADDRELALVLRGWFERMVAIAVREDCGELFTVGSDGLSFSYQISAAQGSGRIQTLALDSWWTAATGSLGYDTPTAEMMPFASHLVRQGERVLSTALNLGRLADFSRIAAGSSLLFRHVDYIERREKRDPAASRPTGSEDLRRLHRVALMALAGRAVMLDQESGLSDVGAYIAVARENTPSARSLASDVSWALGADLDDYLSWMSWEREALPDGGGSVDPSRYLLSFFAIRLLEMTDPASPRAVNLDGQAMSVFHQVSDRLPLLAQYAETGDPHDQAQGAMDERVEAVLKVLSLAVKQDEVEADWDVIRSKLDSDLQASFIASVYASRIENSVLEPLFDGLGGFAYLPADSPSAPALRVASHWIHRSAFVAPTWAPHENNPSGSTLEAALFDDLEAAAVDAPAVQARLGSTDDALAAIDEAMSSIEAAGSGLIVFFGNWLETNISMHVPSGEFTPNWQTTTPESASDGLLGHYRGSPVVDAFSAGPPRILVLDLPRWGCLLRAPMANGEEMQIDIEPVTAELARKRLDEDSGHFPNESDDEGKLRKLQTLVQSVINERVGFVVKDASFARWIRPETDEPATDTEDSPPASADEDDGD